LEFKLDAYGLLDLVTFTESGRRHEFKPPTSPIETTRR
jgi:hypothetical protein